MVKAWRETVTIPTYEVGKAEKSPMFLEKRVYQGSSGVVYPYPVIESIADAPTPHDWNVVWLENEYIKVMIMPELGGRIQMAYDKIKQRHFVYYNHVIKPALVGLAGPWISGGIEFNWPQHHRPSTYMAVDSTIVENADGSVTVWVNEMERMFHQKAAAGFTLRPGCAYLEIQGRVSNRTPLPQTFLWWANPAVEVNDQYQSVFPPDVNAVFDHGKRAVSSFPIATGTYYKVDYSAGVDISNYRNIPVPTSYMAVNSKYDFEGGYENDTKGGMLHVASHHYSPGKKQWTWGNGDFGRAWDRNLTDEASPEEARRWHLSRNGIRPYIELMAGVYTENQPDFTWLMPYEEKQFVQYFMPYREVGIVKQATKDFVMNIEGTSGGVCIKVLATSEQTVHLTLSSKTGETFFDQTVVLSPTSVFVQTVDVKGEKTANLVFAISREHTRLQPGGHGTVTSVPLLSWQAEPDDIRPIPEAATAALSPADTKANDQLYLTGLHLEQYRHATWSALDYYEEALRRDPDDVRCLNQTGLWYLRRGRFDKALGYLQRAVKIWQKRNPNPYDGEAVYNLALCLKYLYRSDEAYALFWKSTWNKAWADAGYFGAASISMSQGRYDDALDELQRCLIFNSCNHKARALKAAVLRKLADRTAPDGSLGAGNDGAPPSNSPWSVPRRQALIEESLQLDRFNYGILYEKYLLTADEDVLKQLKHLMHRSDAGNTNTQAPQGSSNNYDELALDYLFAGLYDEAVDIWTMAMAEGAVSPMTYYYTGYARHRQGREDEAAEWFRKAEQADSYCCFPNRLEDVLVLNTAKTVNATGARAPYYLGCLYYDKRQYDLAVENWELSSALDPRFPTVWRNLALALFNKLDRGDEAVEYMERAFRLDETDARMLMELDQLYKRLHRPHQQRLDLLQRHPGLIARRDDLVLEEITLLNQLGRYHEAMGKLDAHRFHPWEGGEGKVAAQYQMCRVELAKQALAAKHYPQAVELLSACLTYPHHLGEGKLSGAQENDFHYLLGLAYDGLGQHHQAHDCWEKAAQGPQEPTDAKYYNDAQPDKIFYQGLALSKLGRQAEANGRFHRLVNYGKQHLFEHQVMDYFAVSLPDLLIWNDSLDSKNLIHCNYMLALGYYGLGDTVHAMKFLEQAEALDNNHQGTAQFRSLMETFHQLAP